MKIYRFLNDKTERERDEHTNERSRMFCEIHYSIFTKECDEARAQVIRSTSISLLVIIQYWTNCRRSRRYENTDKIFNRSEEEKMK